MPDIAAQIAALPGLGWIIFAAALAGLVRGFSGFGTAMIFLPVAAQYLSPVWAIMALIGMDLFGPLVLVRRAAREASGRDLSLLLVACALSLPVGVWLLTQVAPETYRYIISGLALGLVICLVAGLRYRGRPSAPIVGATGAVAGISGGLAGVPGPPVILLYMASSLPVAQVRANNMLFLLGFDAMFLFVLWVSGQGALPPFVLGLCLAIPNALGSLVGQAIFDPARADMYRYVAYAIVAVSAVLGLPLWD